MTWVGCSTYSPPEVDRIWGIWGSYYDIPKTIFYLLKGDYIWMIAGFCVIVSYQEPGSKHMDEHCCRILAQGRGKFP